MGPEIWEPDHLNSDHCKYFLEGILCLSRIFCTPFHAFADDNQIMESNKDIEQLKISMKLKLEVITKWLKDSGLVVNEKKTELCLFHKNPQPLVELQINNDLIRSKNIINVLGITFDSQMKWEQQVSQAIKNSRQALHGVR